VQLSVSELSRDFDMDLLMVVFTILFFAVAIGYTTACEKLK
jgi:hypothetical protein